MKQQRFFIRRIDAGIYQEGFLVAAVSSLLLIRLYLRLTGYPQLGGGGLHIAHMLWGGLLMVAAIIILFSFLSKSAVRLAAIVGGIGFGMFIDEVGKFVTSDNNYFFRPAVALIYIVFILIFLAVRSIQTRQRYSSQEYLVNALLTMQDIVLFDLNAEKKRRALHYLAECDPNHPLVTILRDSLAGTDLAPSPRPGFLTRLKSRTRAFYHTVVKSPLFPSAVIIFFAVELVVKVVYVLLLVFFMEGHQQHFQNMPLVSNIDERLENLSFVDYAQLSSSFLSGVFVLLGILQVRRSRLSAFRMFKRSILVSILLTQVFIFYKEQFAALLWLIFNLLVFGSLRFMINRERAILKR